MNAIDILGSLLGGGLSGGGGSSGGSPADILAEILGGQSAPTSAHQSSQVPTDIFGQRKRQEQSINLSVPKPAPLSQNDQAVLLIRAMINSAKVDGEITEEEQKNILSQVGDTSPETLKFLRAEFARPLDVLEFSQTLPLGMEQKAYGISLRAIKLDTKEEADYLRQLANALRISPEACNQIHQQQNAPLMYQA